MSIINNGLLLASEAAAAGGYTVSRSLRFNSSDGAYLSRTPASAGNRRTWTFSCWMKLGAPGTVRQIFTCRPTSSPYALFYIFSDDKISFADNTLNTHTTAAVYRDPSAWYHVQLAVATTSATASDRVRLWINGTLQAWGSTTAPAQNAEGQINTATAHSIGSPQPFANNEYFSGYLADIHFIDGQALTPSSFAEANATTGQWVPKAYTGSYGTNGFRLTFSDNSGTTATTLGKDAAGSNNWTPNNFSVAAGAGNDSLVDTPSSYGTGNSGGDVRGNYCTLSPLASTGSTLSNGNLEATIAIGTNTNLAVGSIAVTSGKWYWEVVTADTGENRGLVGVCDINAATKTYTSANGWGYWNADGYKYTNNSGQAYGATWANGDVIGVALDMDGNSLTFYKNGVSQGVAYSSVFSGKVISPAFFNPAGASSRVYIVNFGQRPFAYTAPSGFKALCDTNLPTPVVAKPSSAFDCVTYTGTGATLTPTSSLGFSPDLVWIKSRSAATDNTIYDAVRGAQARLESNNTDAEVTSDGGLTAFNSNGFTLGTLAQVNTNAATYVAWCWDEAVADGFDIVTYTGNGANRTIAHSLGVAPSLMIVKQRTAASTTNWAVWHSSLANTEYLLLNSTAAKTTGATYWNSTSPTGSVFSLGTSTDVNANNGTYVAYLWSPVNGYSSFGSYVGNGSASDGPFVYTGFRPRFVLIKNVTNVDGWMIKDTARSTYNPMNEILYPESSNAEGSRVPQDFLSNGFKVRDAASNHNTNGSTYIYAAFAENPFQYARAR